MPALIYGNRIGAIPVMSLKQERIWGMFNTYLKPALRTDNSPTTAPVLLAVPHPHVARCSSHKSPLLCWAWQIQRKLFPLLSRTNNSYILKILVVLLLLVLGVRSCSLPWIWTAHKWRPTAACSNKLAASSCWHEELLNTALVAAMLLLLPNPKFTITSPLCWAFQACFLHLLVVSCPPLTQWALQGGDGLLLFHVGPEKVQQCRSQ